MSNFKNELDGYQTIPRELIFDSSISDRARFLYCYMASKPEGWNFYIASMSKELGYSRQTLQKYISELIEHGWLERNGQSKTSSGCFASMVYTLKSTVVNFLPHGKNSAAEKFDYIDKLDIIDKRERIKKEEKEKDEKEKEASDEPTLGLDVAEPLTELETPSKPDKKALDLSSVDADFLPIVEDWLDYKKERRETYKPRGFDAFYKRLVKLSGGNASKAKEIVEQSKANNYAGIFPIKSGHTDNLPVGYILREENMGKKKTSEW